MKSSNDNIGNRTRDPPARSTVPQPTAPPRAPVKYLWTQYPTSYILASNKCQKKISDLYTPPRCSFYLLTHTHFLHYIFQIRANKHFGISSSICTLYTRLNISTLTSELPKLYESEHFFLCIYYSKYFLIIPRFGPFR
jgi:hypothetical protein